MSNAVKFLIYALVFTFILGGLLFSWILGLLPDTISLAKVSIEFLPIEFRIAIFLVFAWLILALGKTFFN